MKIVITGRQGGKTLQLLAAAHGKNGYIVCKDKRAVDWTYAQAQDLGLDIRFPITHEDLLDREALRGSCIKSLIIDDADVLIQRLCRFPVEAIAMTGETSKAQAKLDALAALLDSPGGRSAGEVQAMREVIHG